MSDIVWRALGDQPDVIPFESGFFEPQELHGNCGHTWGEHGMLEVQEGDEVGFAIVCPGDTVVDTDGVLTLSKTGTVLTPEDVPGLTHTSEELPS